MLAAVHKVVCCDREAAGEMSEILSRALLVTRPNPCDVRLIASTHSGRRSPLDGHFAREHVRFAGQAAEV
jgi:hypothetical protein